MNVYDIEFNAVIGSTTRSILARNMAEAYKLANKMLQVALINLWEDITIDKISFVCEITEFKEFVSEVKEKGKEIRGNSEEEQHE